MEEKEKETNQMKEYLRIKKIEEDNKSDELIDEIYNKATKKESDNKIR